MRTAVPVAEFQQAMAAFPAGITAVTTVYEGEPAGLIATSVCSVSAEPPSILVCVNQQAAAHHAIVSAGFFAVNLLTVGQRDVVDRFRTLRGPGRFEDERWSRLETGAPVLSDAAVVLDCVLDARHEGFSHTILVGVVKASRVAGSAQAGSLLWHGRGYAHALPLEK